MAPTEGLHRVAPSWWFGFRNQFRKEIWDWFRPRNAIPLALVVGVAALLPLLCVGGSIVGAIMSVQAPLPIGELAQALPVVQAREIGAFVLAYAALVGAGVTIVRSHDAVSGELSSGIAEWMLTKPIARSALILSKAAAHLIGNLVFALALPFTLALGPLVLLTRGSLAPHLVEPFLVLVPYTVFSTCLAVACSALLGQRLASLALTAAVVPLQLQFFLTGLIVGSVPAGASQGIFGASVGLLPITTVVGAVSILNPAPLDATLSAQVGSALLLSLLYAAALVALALARFRRTEF